MENSNGNNGNTETICELCSKLTMKTSERRRSSMELLAKIVDDKQMCESLFFNKVAG